MRKTLIALLIVVFSTPVLAADRFNMASLEKPQFEYQPAPPLWEDNPNINSYQQPLTPAARKRSPLAVNGGVLAAPNARKDINPAGTNDRMNRMLESRLTEQYGSEGWEQMNIDGQLRFAKPGDLEQGVLSPYVSGGMGMTQLAGTPPAGEDMLGAQPTDALGLRYGAGLAYTIGDEFDLTAGYRVNRMQDRATTVGPNDRLNVQMLDFGLRYKY